MDATALPQGDGHSNPQKVARRYRSVPGLAELGDGRISYAERMMPLLSALHSRFSAELYPTLIATFKALMPLVRFLNEPLVDGRRPDLKVGPHG